jgi:hypothetical protein
VAPTVFRSEMGGYERWRAYAQTLGRDSQWALWTEDEMCAQRNVAEDAASGRGGMAWCDRVPSASCDPASSDNARTTAGPLMTGVDVPARVCASDEDWYRVSASATVTIRFEHAQGDIDMEAYDANGVRIASSTSVQNQETVAGTGTFFVRVYGYRGAINSYTIAAR